METTSFAAVHPRAMLTIAAALLGVAAASHLLGAAPAPPQRLYATAAVRTTLRTPAPAAAHRHRLGLAAGPVSEAVLPDATTSPSLTSTAQTQPWLLPVVSFGSVVVGALLYAWTSARQGPSASAEEWRVAAVELEEGFPGPGNPNDEFEVTVVWGGEERKLKVKGDQSILMACEEAGLHVPYLCRHGVCLECTGQVLEGNEHARRDSQCHDAENVKAGYICTCSTYVGGNGMKVQMGMVEEA
eukprot:EG_transcript_25938